MGALAIDPKPYARLLVKTLPRVIHTEKEYQRVLAQVEPLMDKGDRRTAEEDALLELMVALTQVYEEKHYPLPEVSPAGDVGLPDGEARTKAG